MNGIIAVLITTISFSIINLQFKKLRNKGVETSANIALFSFSIPLLLGMLVYLLSNFSVQFSLKYLFFVLIWLVPVFLSVFGKYFMYKYQSLTELTAYRLGFSTLIAILLDIFYFKSEYNLLTFVAIALFIGSGYILSKNKIKKIKDLSLGLGILILFVSAMFKALEYGVYKQGLIMQETILFHVVFTQVILYLIFLLIGIKPLIKNIKNKKINYKHISIVTFFIFVAVVFESYAVSSLPIAIVISASMIPMALYSFYDFKNKEIKVTKSSIIALAMIALSLLILII